MTGRTGSLSLFLIARLFLMVESHTGQVLPPQNLSLLWINDFQPQLTWDPLQHSAVNCTFQVLSYKTGISEDSFTEDLHSPPWTRPTTVMNGGFLHFSVVTKCDNRESEPAVLNVSYPVMRDVQCYRYSSNDVTCFWKPAAPKQSVHFFYRVVKKYQSLNEVTPLPPLQECSSYNITLGVRTGCRLQSNLQQEIQILFNGTVNNTPFRNTFSKDNINDVKESLNWTVKKDGNKFTIGWNTPDITSGFQAFQINYTECQKKKDLLIQDIKQTSYELNRLPDCQYRMAMKACYSKFNTEWSEEKYFDAETDAYGWVYAVVLTPLVLAGLTVLTFVCCRKIRIHIFPQVPQPRDHLTDIFDNNNKSTVGNMYIPAEEDDFCKITLLTDPVDIDTNGAFPSSPSENKVKFCDENSS
nr:PREDICTED: interleukin-13 receptor subunit alpha-1-like isoform X1 [Paralichthys olivaceus]